jgi:hypothetical protein
MASARVVVLALLVAACSAGALRAQALWQSQAPGSWPLPTVTGQEYVAQFTTLRSEVERMAIAARAGAEKRLSRAQIRKLVAAYSTVESKWVQMNVTKCGTPDSIVDQMKTVHVTTVQGQTKLCAAGLEPGDLREHHPDYRFGPPTQPHDFPPKSLPRFSGR